VILIHLLLIFTESKMFQQTDQMILKGDSDSTENYFLIETETFLNLKPYQTHPKFISGVGGLCLFSSSCL
jgi:hypothetical protein